MDSVKIDREKLLEIVIANRELHVKQYDEAVEDYKAAALKLATSNLKLAKTGEMEKIAQIRPIPTPPVSYESNYSRAIRMLELSVEDVISVEQDTFNQLVLDEWSWKRSFIAAGSLYKSMS